VTEQRTAEQQNIEPQNFEGWNRYALSFELLKIDKIPSFDIRYSLFPLESDSAGRSRFFDQTARLGD